MANKGKVVGASVLVLGGMLVFGGLNKDKITDFIDGGNSPTPTITMSEDGKKNDGVQGEGGGNEFDENNGNASGDETTEIIPILIEEGVYSYDGELYELDELVTFLQSLKGEFVVELRDDDATHKAYSTLVDKLKELEIAYTEK